METQTLITELLGPKGLLEAYEILGAQRLACNQPEVVEGIEMAQARVGVAIYTLLRDIDVVELPDEVRSLLIPIKTVGLEQWARLEPRY